MANKMWVTVLHIREPLPSYPPLGYDHIGVTGAMEHLVQRLPGASAVRSHSEANRGGAPVTGHLPDTAPEAYLTILDTQECDPPTSKTPSGSNCPRRWGVAASTPVRPHLYVRSSICTPPAKKVRKVRFLRSSPSLSFTTCYRAGKVGVRGKSEADHLSACSAQQQYPPLGIHTARCAQDQLSTLNSEAVPMLSGLCWLMGILENSRKFT